MSLPAAGNPISANMINVEAQRTGTTFAPLSGNLVPITTSLVGLYVNSGVNQSAPHAYSEFYGKTYVAPASPYWFVNTTNTPSIGKKYQYSGSNVIQNNSSALGTNYNTTLSAYGGSGLAINSDELLVSGGSVSSSGTVSGERHPLLTCYNETTGLPDISTAYDWTGTVYHWTSDMQFIDGFSNQVFWVEQEKATDNDGATDRRRYGVVHTDTTTAVFSGSNVTYPKLFQYTNMVRRIDNSTYQQGYFYSSPKISTINFANAVSPYTDTTKSYIYVCNQIKNENLGDAQEYNGGIVRMTYEPPQFKGGTTSALTSPIFKVYQQNPGSAGSPWGTSDMTTFADLCVVPYGDFDPR